MVLKSTFFGSVAWYAMLARAKEPVYIEACENFVKQTERSRCVIATANGTQKLTVPVGNPIPTSPLGVPLSEGRKAESVSISKIPIREVRISDHDNWRRQHWNTLCTAYGESPFFDYYADDLRPFFEKKWDYLFDYNLEITHKMCELLDISPDIRLTNEFVPSPKPDMNDFREVINNLKPYYQVFGKRHGFIGNLSILDLLFNEGNEAILTLL